MKHQRRTALALSPDLSTNTVDYTYDANGQLKTATGREADASTRQMEQLGYFYDAAGNLTRRTNNALVQSFTVNNLNQLSNATRSGNLTVAGATTIAASSVTVADNGNSPVSALRYADATFARTNVTLLNGNNTFVAVATDALGRGDTNTVTVNLPTAVTFLYDQNGNLRTNGTRIFEYDDENQLTRITEPSAWKSEFVYDGKMRRRIRREFRWSGSWVLTNEVRYVYDGNLVLQERDQFNLPKLTYTRGNDLSGSLESAGGIGGLLAFTRASSGRLESFYYHADGNGNVTALVDASQQVGARYVYDPFGNTLSASGPLAEANLYRFSSKEWHGPSGLLYYLYRFYEPSLQRWLNRDPLGEKGGSNLYRFTKNAPVASIDAFGLCSKSACLKAADALDDAVNTCYLSAGVTCAAAWATVGVGCGIACLGTGPLYALCVSVCIQSFAPGVTAGCAAALASCGALDAAAKATRAACKFCCDP